VLEVETEEFIRYVGACLLAMISEDLSQSRLEKVYCRVVSSDIGTLLFIDLRGYSIAYGEDSVFDNGCMEIYARLCLLCVGNRKESLFAFDDTCIAYLSAAFGIEGSSVKNDDSLTLA